MKRSLYILPALLPWLVLCGCAAYQSASGTDESAYQSAAGTVEDSYTWLTLDHEYRAARKAYREERYGEAATRFENLIDRLPESSRREQVLYWQGIAYYRLKDYNSAEANFRDYMERYPEGAHLADASEYRMRITVDRSKPNRAGADQLEKARSDLAALLTIEEEHPTDPEVKYLLGNIFYELEQYDTAGKKYLEAQKLEAYYKEKDLIRKRLFINDRGEPEVLTPASLNTRARERDPLVVFDLNPYRQRGNPSFSAQEVFQVITGKVRNQGSRTLNDVVVEIRFLDAVNRILDVREHRIGRMRSGDVRAFWARTDRYDNILNVTRIDAVARADR